MQAWEAFLKEQEKTFGKQNIQRWVRSLTVRKFDARNIYLEAEDSFQLLWFEEHIRPKLKEFFNSNKKPIKVHIVHLGQEKVKREKKPELDEGLPLTFDDFDPTYTFSTFIPQKETRIPVKLLEEFCDRAAQAKLSALSEQEKTVSVPLEMPVYLYGASGSGKTHLLNAVGHKLQQSGFSIRYLRAELFAEHVVKAIKAGKMQQFRKLYRDADVLIIDDVEALARKNATQEEFFHTFNALHDEGKYIFLASRLSPQHLTYIEPRLISRFHWGITLSLTPIIKNDILIMLEKKAEALNIVLPKQTALFLANTFSSSAKSAVKALQALILRCHTTQNQLPFKMPIAKIELLLKDLIEEEQIDAITIEGITLIVASYFGVTKDDILGKSQQKEFAVPRKLTMYLARKLLQLPYMKIGDYLSRDHSTVMTAIRDVENKKSDPVIQSDLARLEAELIENAKRKS